MAIIRGLITLAQMRQSIYGKDYATATTANDSDFEAYISAATPWIEDSAGPMYAESRTVTFDGGVGSLPIPFRFNAVSSLTVDGDVVTEYVADPTSGLIHAGTSTNPDTFATGTQNVVVVVTVGYATIPPNVQLATRELCRLWWQNGRQANSIVPDEAQLTPGILGRVRALLDPSLGLPGFA